MKTKNKIVTLFAALCVYAGIAGADEYVSCVLELQTDTDKKPVVAWLNLVNGNLTKSERQKTAPNTLISHNIVFEPPSLTKLEDHFLPKDENKLYDYKPEELIPGAAKDGLTTLISLQNKSGTSVVSVHRVRDFASKKVLWQVSGIYNNDTFLPFATCKEVRLASFSTQSINTYKAAIDLANRTYWNP